MKRAEKLIQQFIKAAILHGESSDDGKYKIANRQYTIITKIINELKNDPNIGLSSLTPLLEHQNNYVKLAAAVYLLQINHQKAETVLEVLSQRPKALGLNAERTLKEWKKQKF